MDLLRLALVIFLIAHGIGHIIWFVGAWTPVAMGIRDGAWLLPGTVTIHDAAGKVLGLLAAMALGFFLGAAWALLARDESWRFATVVGCVLSLVAVVPWWRRSPGPTALNATIADIGLLLFLLLPVSAELVDAA